MVKMNIGDGKHNTPQSQPFTAGSQQDSMYTVQANGLSSTED